MENKILNQIRVILGLQVKLEKTILSDGTEIEFENLEIGTIIKSNNEPLKEGDYILEDGRTIVIDVDGKIVEIKEAEKKDEEPKGDEETKVDETTTDLSPKLAELKANIESITTMVNEISLRVDNLETAIQMLGEKSDEMNGSIEKFSSEKSITDVKPTNIKQTVDYAEKIQALKNACK